jgi:prepilin peptidase CpaA
MSNKVAPLLQVVLTVVVLAAACYDLKIRKIPNWLNLSGVILGVGFNCFLLQAAGLRLALLGLGLALLVYFPLFVVRGMGAGDVKLMAAVGAIAGPRNWLYIFLATAILGGLVALVLVVYKRRLFLTLLNLSTILGELLHIREPFQKNAALDFRHERALGLPHGAMIAFGAIAFLSFNSLS